VISPGNVDKHVLTLALSPLDYPIVPRQRGNIGDVVFAVLVQEDGKVAETKIISSSGYPRLDHAALGVALEAWTFEPARLNGQPSEVVESLCNPLSAIQLIGSNREQGLFAALRLCTGEP
jgi:TonB family protein